MLAFSPHSPRAQLLNHTHCNILRTTVMTYSLDFRLCVQGTHIVNEVNNIHKLIVRTLLSRGITPKPYTSLDSFQCPKQHTHVIHSLILPRANFTHMDAKYLQEPVLAS